MLAGKPTASSASHPTPPSRISRQIERAEIIKTTPPRCRLFSPLFEKAENGFVEFPLTHLMSFRRVARCVIVQALVFPPSAWQHSDVWEQITHRILKLADHVEECPKQMRGRR